jgi:hypothetical protein
VGNTDDPKTIVERFCGGTDTKAAIYLYVDKCDDKFSAKSILFVRS